MGLAHIHSSLHTLVVSQNIETQMEQEIANKTISDLRTINFWPRLTLFIENVQVGDMPSEEEKQMILHVSREQSRALAHQPKLKNGSEYFYANGIRVTFVGLSPR